MEIRVSFVVGGVEVVIVTDQASDLTKVIKDVTGSIKEALEAEAIPKVVGPRVQVSQPIALAGTIQDRIRSLASQLDTGEEQIQEAIHFDDEYPILLRPVGGNGRVEQQRRALLMLGSIFDLVYEKREVGATLYGVILRKSSVDQQRLDHALERLRGRFIVKGVGRGTSYEITVPGRNEGLALLRDLIAAPS